MNHSFIMAFTSHLKAMFFITCFSFTTFFFALSSFAQDIIIYSERQPDLIKPLITLFEQETGLKSQVQYFNKGMLERLRAEGVNSPADVILTIDIGNLIALKEAGVVTAIRDNAEIEANIPMQYRDAEGEWFGLTMRARLFYASKERVQEDAVDYEDLVDTKWRGRICMRNGQHAYNIALIASMIAHHGEDEAKAWLEGVKANLIGKPNGNDRAQAKAIYAGACDIAIGNSYYLGLMKNNESEPEQKEWFQTLKVIFPNQNTRGTHVNISGMALAKYSPHQANALRFMEFLSSPKAQSIYAEQVYEYPLKEGAILSDDVRSFGVLNPDSLDLTQIASWRKRASELVDEIGLNYGP